MKTVLLTLSFIIPTLSFAQYILIDAKGKAAKAADLSAASSITDLVILERDKDSVVALLEVYQDLQKSNTPAGFDRKTENAGASVINVTAKKSGYVDRYEITVETVINGTRYRRQLTFATIPNGENAKRLKAFIEQLERL